MTAQGVQIRTAASEDAARWNAFLETCPAGNFYQRFEWEAVNRDALGHRTHFLLAEREREVAGVLPLVHVKSRLFGHFLCSMPFVNYGGAAASDPSAEAELIAEARAHAEATGCRYLEVRSDRALETLQAVSTKVSMTVTLDSDPDTLWTGFSTKHRTNVRRAYKNGIEVRSGGHALMDPFFGLMTRAWRGLGTPLYARSYFDAVLSHFGADIRIFVAYQGEVPVAATLNGHFRGTVEGMWAATDPAHWSLQPNYVLYWEMLKDACERGFRTFHLGRSTAGSQAARFKEKWGARAEPLFWNYHLVGAHGTPALNPTNPRYRLAIRAWQKLPLPVTRLLGPPLARLIP